MLSQGCGGGGAGSVTFLPPDPQLRPLQRCQGVTMFMWFPRLVTTPGHRKQLSALFLDTGNNCQHCSWTPETTVSTAPGHRKQLSALLLDTGNNCQHCSWTSETTVSTAPGHRKQLSALLLDTGNNCQHCSWTAKTASVSIAPVRRDLSGLSSLTERRPPGDQHG